LANISVSPVLIITIIIIIIIIIIIKMAIYIALIPCEYVQISVSNVYKIVFLP